ncbi:MATH and LRR domain-containing protein PFE0570w-like isoform X2 [Hylaeus volcanicus]|uniref:MATH and LRR domain-containing protein PFE0570w-like isoform X2 n=1 Tax=Hylaeus volcanicus TaxID=313075 RepID=UPI0023B85835|nr:MATH and LRR domain-containing protein PFE0570w-like isoform X2 [Hylaeus volcanicus]
MTKLTKIKFRDQMKSNKSKLSNTVSMKRGKMNKSNLNLVERDSYLVGSNINIETVMNKEQNVLHDRKKCFNDKVTKKHGKKKTMKKNVTVPITELNSQTSEIVPELCNKKLNASILCTNSNKKSHEFSNSVENTILSNCTIRLSVESNKKSLTNVVQKYRTRLKNKQKNQEMIQTEPERRILEYYQKDHKTRETKNSTKASNTINTVVLGQDSLIPPEEKHTSRLVKMQNKRKVIEKNVNINNAQLNVQSPRLLRSSRKRDQVLEEGIFEISRKKTNNTKTVLTLQNNISTNCNRQHEEHTCYRDDSDEENQTETFNRNTTLEHRINKSEENSMKSNVLRNGSLINSSEQRVKTRSTINRRYHQETQNTPTLTSLTSSTSNRNTLKSVYIDKQTLNDENISEFMYENRGNKKKLNETKMSRVIPAENNSNIYSCNLRNDISSRDDVLKKDHSQDRSVINVSQRQRNLNNFVMNCPEREFLKLQNTESVTQGIPQTNLRHLVDSKLQNDRNISMEIEKEGTYESCESVKIGNLKKSQSRKLKETETRESEYCIQINENIVIDKNCTYSKKLTVPLVRVEDLSLYERLQLLHTPHYIEKRRTNREENETHYHSTTEKINNKISITNRHLNNCTNQTTALSRSFEKQMESIHLDKKIDTNLKTIDFISLNQFTEQTLKNKETEKVFKESHDYSILISDEQCNSTFVNHKSVVVKEHVNSEENKIQLKSDKYGLYSQNENNKTETLENMTSKLQAGQLLENILNFFLKHKQDTTNKGRKKSQYSNTEEKCGKRKCVAMCIKSHHENTFTMRRKFTGYDEIVCR